MLSQRIVAIFIKDKKDTMASLAIQNPRDPYHTDAATDLLALECHLTIG